MNRKRFTILVSLALVTGVCLGFLALFAAGKAMAVWRAPLGPALELPTRTPTATAAFTLTPGPTAFEPVTIPTLTPYDTATLIPEPATPTLILQPKCGGPPVMILLAIGSDQRGDSYNYGLSDVMRIIRVDFVTPRVTVLEFPRDLYVEIPDISDHYGITHGKLNQAFLYGNTGFGYYDGPGGGPGLLARTLELNFGLAADHYGAVNMQTFVRIVDAVGGVDVVLDRSINGNAADSDPPKKDLIFSAGYNHLNGKRALILARLRPNGTFERAEHQNLVVCALRDKLLSPKVVTRIPDLIQSFRGSVLTDLSPEQISQLACLAPQVTGKNLIFASFPEEMFKGTRVNDPILGNTFILEADFDLLRAYAHDFIDGTWPEVQPAGSLTTVTPDPVSGIGFCP